MNEDLTIKGYWWLPEKPEKVLAGEITYGPATGARLSLHDYFFEDTETQRFTVYGSTVNGKQITLFDCHTKKLTMHTTGARVSEVSCYFGVVGGHFATPAEMKFNKITVDLSHLYEWVGASGISFAQRTSEKAFLVTLMQLPDISLGSWGEFNAALEFTSQLTPEHGICTMSESCFLTLETTEPTPYNDFKEVVNKFQHFVAFGVACPVYALSVKARHNEPKYVINGQNIYNDYEIIQKLSLTVTTKENLSAVDMQFCLGDLVPDLSSCIKLYFDKYKLLKPVYDLYFSTVYNPDMYVHQRFLALAHAIEAYHRATVKIGKYQSDDKYEKGLLNTLWNALPQDLDKDFRVSLKNKFKYLHEFSLRKRIKDICEKHGAVLRPLLGEPGTFATSVADQRNLLTHPDSTDKDRPQETDWRQLWLMSEQLSLLLEICLLHEIGFDFDKISKLMSGNRRAQSILMNQK